jgi:hypothetical protein
MTTVSFRETEHKQLRNLLPDIIDLYYEKDIGDRAEPIEAILETIEDGTRELDLDEDTWSELTIGLRQLLWINGEQYSSNRVSWLRAKIARRAGLSASSMGFTSEPPAMAYATGQDPVSPE